MRDYLIIIKDTILDSYSPAEMQESLKAYKNWAGGLADQYLDGQRLDDESSKLPRTGSIPTDGPFLESKEMISGYVMIKANNLEEATEIARRSPLLAHSHLEVRPIKIMPQ